MNDIFKLRNTNGKKCKLNNEIPTPNQVTLGTRGIRIYGPKKLNALPYHIKTLENPKSFEAILKCWDGNH